MPIYYQHEDDYERPVRYGVFETTPDSEVLIEDDYETLAQATACAMAMVVDIANKFGEKSGWVADRGYVGGGFWGITTGGDDLAEHSVEIRERR